MSPQDRVARLCRCRINEDRTTIYVHPLRNRMRVAIHRGNHIPRVCVDQSPVCEVINRKTMSKEQASSDDESESFMLKCE